MTGYSETWCCKRLRNGKRKMEKKKLTPHHATRSVQTDWSTHRWEKYQSNSSSGSITWVAADMEGIASRFLINWSIKLSGLRMWSFLVGPGALDNIAGGAVVTTGWSSASYCTLYSRNCKSVSPNINKSLTWYLQSSQTVSLPSSPHSQSRQLEEMWVCRWDQKLS